MVSSSAPLIGVLPPPFFLWSASSSLTLSTVIDFIVFLNSYSLKIFSLPKTRCSYDDFLDFSFILLDLIRALISNKPHFQVDRFHHLYTSLWLSSLFLLYSNNRNRMRNEDEYNIPSSGYLIDPIQPTTPCFFIYKFFQNFPSSHLLDLKWN